MIEIRDSCAEFELLMSNQLPKFPYTIHWIGSDVPGRYDVSVYSDFGSIYPSTPLSRTAY